MVESTIADQFGADVPVGETHAVRPHGAPEIYPFGL
jgi:hypothetical protein